MVERDFYSLFGVPAGGFDSSPFMTSSFLPAYALATIRFMLSIYLFITIIFSFKWVAGHTVTFSTEDIKAQVTTYNADANWIRYSFSDFSYLSYWGLAFFMLVTSVHTFTYAHRRYTWLDRWPRILQLLHSVFYTTVTTCPILISIVYWGSIWTRTWPPDRFSQWNMISIYALNSAFAVFEIIVPNTQPLPWAHLSVIGLCMSLYIGLAYITKATEGIYIYRWLDPGNGVKQLILHIVCYAALMFGIFVFVRCVISIRWQLISRAPKTSMGFFYEKRQPGSYESETSNSNSSSSRDMGTDKELEVPFINVVRASRSAYVLPLDRIDEAHLPYQGLERENESAMKHPPLQERDEKEDERSYPNVLIDPVRVPPRSASKRFSHRSTSRLSQYSRSSSLQSSPSTSTPLRVTTRHYRLSYQPRQLPPQREEEQQQVRQDSHRRARSHSDPIPNQYIDDITTPRHRHRYSTRQVTRPGAGVPTVTLSPTASLRSQSSRRILPAPACHEPPPVTYPYPYPAYPAHPTHLVHQHQPSHPYPLRSPTIASANHKRLSQLQPQLHEPQPPRQQQQQQRQYCQCNNNNNNNNNLQQLQLQHQRQSLSPSPSPPLPSKSRSRSLSPAPSPSRSKSPSPSNPSSSSPSPPSRIQPYQTYKLRGMSRPESVNSLRTLACRNSWMSALQQQQREQQREREREQREQLEQREQQQGEQSEQGEHDDNTNTNC